MRTLYQWQDDNGGWQRGRLVVDEESHALLEGTGQWKYCYRIACDELQEELAYGELKTGRVFIEPIHRTQFQPMLWVAVSKLQVAPTGEERNG